MRKLLLASSVALLPMAAHADVLINGILYLDPTSFHVTSGVATGSDPVLLNNAKAFSIQDIGGQNISQPITIFIAQLTSVAIAPTITGVNYDNGTITPVTFQATTSVNNITFPTTVTVGNGSGQDLYSLIGCNACGASLNLTNIDAAEAADGNGSPSMFKIYAFQVNQDMVGKDQLDVTGTFADGSIVFPYANNVSKNGKTVTEFDTSWTNTGLVDCNEVTSKCGSVTPPPPPPPPPIPEPSTIAVLGAGLLGLMFLKRRRA